uniref:AlNc14C254G9691 protein n=1 Tax=Albugo laibachii Nc14 TaxID=890382 RepID=F0WTL4_9STRA|nr:AlNc14C254G9691 [Albugo laibachii Nc14]|eukprot:CCA24705.1 AlNc14C254G9691 [Albugo laibachii Nc14]
MKAILFQLFATQIIWKSTSTSTRGHLHLEVLKSSESTPAESVIALPTVKINGKWVFLVIYPDNKHPINIPVPTESFHKRPFQGQSSVSNQACDNEKYQHDVLNVQFTGLRFRGKKRTDPNRLGLIREEVPAKTKLARSLCANDYIFSSYLVAALLNKQRYDERIYSFEWDRRPDPALYTHSTFHQKPIRGPEDRDIYYHTHILTPRDDCEYALGPLYATVRFKRRDEKAQTVHFDYGRVISEVPRHRYTHLSQKLNAILKRDQSDQDISENFPCSRHIYRKMPSIRFIFDGDAKRYSFTSREYIVEITEKYADSEVSTGRCYMAIIPRKNNDNGHWTIGATFAKRYFTRLKRSETHDNAIEFGFESSWAKATGAVTTITVPDSLAVSFDIAM